MAFSVFVIFNADRKQLTFRLLDILIGQVPYNTEFSRLTKQLHASETWPDEPDFSHLMIRKTKETESFYMKLNWRDSTNTTFSHQN